MAGTTLPNSGIVYDWTLGTTYKTEMDANLLMLDTLLSGSVISRSTTAPPGSPASGDRYLIPSGATGAWAGKTNQIAVYIAAAWSYILPKNGFSVLVEDEARRRVKYNGSAWLLESPVRVASASSAAGALTLDLANGNHFQVTLTENVTGITISNFPAGTAKEPITVEFTQDGTGGWTVGGWPAAVKWPGGTAPVISAVAGDVDVIEGFSLDAGTTIRLARTMTASA